MTRRGIIPSRSSHGFTLIEIIVVLLILAVAASLVVPSMKGIGRHREIQIELRRLALAVKLTRSRAITINRPCALILDPKNNSYRVETLQGKVVEGQTEGSSLYEGMQDRTILERTLPVFLHFHRLERMDTAWRRGSYQGKDQEDMDGLWRIHFWPDGTGDDVTLQLRTDEKSSYKLRIYGLIGRTEIYEG